MKNLFAVLFVLSCFTAACQLPDSKDIAAAREFTMILALQSQEDAIKFFQQKKLSAKQVYSVNGVQMSLLHIVLQKNHSKAASFLIKQGADVNLPLRSNNIIHTPLSLALMSNANRHANYTIARELIKYGAKIKVTVMPYGLPESILSTALNSGRIEGVQDVMFVKQLLEMGADPALKTFYRSKNVKRPQSLYALLNTNDAVIAAMLMDKKVKGTPSPSVMKILHSKEPKNPQLLTAMLQKAIACPDLDRSFGDIAELTHAGANPDRLIFDDLGKLDATAVLECLRRHGCKLQQKAPAAAYWGSVTTLEYLLKHKLNVNAVVTFDSQPLSLLAGKIRQQDTAAVDLLLKRGASMRTAGVENAVLELLELQYQLNRSSKDIKAILQILSTKKFKFSDNFKREKITVHQLQKAVEKLGY